MTEPSVQLHVFNVGHGDSLLIEFPGPRWGVVDCNSLTPAAEPPVLQFLRERDVRHLAFVCVTHPHLDHYLGLARVCDYFSTEGRSYDYFVDFGVPYPDIARATGATQTAHLELQRLYQATHARFRSRTAGATRYLGWHHIHFQRGLSGRTPRRPVSADNIRIQALSPDPLQYIATLQRLAERRLQPNELCVSLLVECGRPPRAARLLLAADLEEPLWRMLALAYGEFAGGPLWADLVKVAHHGSARSNPAWLWSEQLAARPADSPAHPLAVVSCSGGAHSPSAETLQSANGAGFRLRCTNRGPACKPPSPLDELRKQSESRRSSPLDQAAALLRARRSVATPCFDTFTVRLAEDGRTEVLRGRPEARCVFD